MAKKGSLSFVELHLEKGILGLAVLFTLFLGVYYLGLEPNKVEFDGQALGPRELDEAIQRKAEDLKRAVGSIQPKTEPVPQYARVLEQSFEKGLWTDDATSGSEVPKTVPVFAQFGTPLPTLEEGVEVDNVALVTPLRPTAAVARTGISLAQRRPARLPQARTAQGADPVPTEDEEAAVGFSWVTVAAYFPLQAQQAEMTKAGYAAYRAKPYVAGIDVQRQEMTASGEYSDWKDVAPGKAMLQLDIPAPIYDDKSGDLINQAELDEKLELVKRAQSLIMQAPFYPVEAGDEWEIPPLPGHEPVEEEEVVVDIPGPETPAPARTGGDERPRTAPPPPVVAPPTGPRGGGRGVRGPRGGGQVNPFTPLPTTPTPQQDAGRGIKEDLREAKKAVREKQWDRAEQLARGIASNGDASRSDRTQAERILRDVAKARAAQQRRETGRTPTAATGTTQEITLVTNPEKEGEPAVWFHDDSVEPGKTYRYRLRVKLWNRYVGRRASLKDPSQADQTLLASEWSLPTAPLTVAPKRHFFVRSPVFGEPAASVDVFTWYKGNWLKEDFKVRVGDVIGNALEVKTGELDKDDKPKKERVDFSTDALVLDLRVDEPVLLRRAAGKAGEFSYREAKSLVLVYLDPADGQVKERIADVDRSDPLYTKLKAEWDTFREGL